MSLVEKIRKARETKVEAGGFTFVIRRPTALEMAEMPAISRGRAIVPFVIGWEGVREIDVIPGGDPHPLAFSADVCAEWLGDRLDLLSPLATAVFDSFTAYQSRIEGEKKS
jgi:hypothetical protein